eukprot:XP_019929985.1 PREDICTED: von Willebrand factor A domain-containing protein 7-like [Crassostrea gigas]
MRFHVRVLQWIMIFIMETNAFYPNSLVPFLSDGDYTHESITEFGISRVIQELRNRSGRSFPVPHNRGFVPKFSLDEIMMSINNVHKNYKNDPMWHFNNEQIVEANEKLKHYRRIVLDVLQSPNPDFSEARKYLGFCLHLLQSFYSNTNWVELNGQALYMDLGLPGKQLLPISPTEKSTCIACSTEEDIDGCADNLIDNGDLLTSGYRSDIDSNDQTGSQIVPRFGKCGHSESSFRTTEKLTVVSGGINKETTNPQLSPHFRLHNTAASAAIYHTSFFLIDKQNGIIKDIGQRKLELLLGLIKEETLVFIIDTSPGMSTEVEALDKFIQSVARSPSTVNYKFVLATVGKDVENIDVNFFSTVFEMRKAVSKIMFDTQPYCDKPILKAINMVSKVVPKLSKIYIFTDSVPSARNEESPDLEAKKLVMNFYLKETCNVPLVKTFRQKISHNIKKVSRQRRRAFSVPLSFSQIASSSGGQIYTGISSLNLLNIGSSLDPEVTIVKLDFPGGFGGFSTLSVPADSTITKLIIKIDGISALPTSRIKDQNGNLLYAGANGQTNITESDFGTVTLMEIVNPTPGLYFIEKIINTYWKIEVRAVSELDFSAQLMMSDANSYALTEIEGRPTVGENVTVIVTVSLPENVTSVSDLVLLNNKGTTLTNSKLQKYSGHKQGVFYCNVIIPPEDFQIAIDGEDGQATQFRRLHTKLISPVLIKLDIHPFPNPLYTGRNFIIQYTVTNLGAGLTEILTSIRDSQQFAVSPFNKTHQLAAGANITDMFVLHGGATPGITTSVTITAEPLTSGNSNFQYSIFSLTTEDPSNKTPDTTPPDCNITKVIGSCSGVTQCDCNMTVVTTKLEIFDIGEGMKTISYGGSGGNGVNFTHKPFIAGLELSQGTVIAKLVADCCRASEDITLTDWTSTSTCTVPVNPSWTPGPCTTTPPPTTTTGPTTDSSTSVTTDSSTSNAGTTSVGSSNGQTGGGSVTTTLSVTQTGSNAAASQSGSVYPTSGSSVVTTTVTSVSSSSNSNGSESGLSTTWKIVIATSATAISVAALFTGGILLRKKFTSVSPN